MEPPYVGSPLWQTSSPSPGASVVPLPEWGRPGRPFGGPSCTDSAAGTGTWDPGRQEIVSDRIQFLPGGTRSLSKETPRQLAEVRPKVVDGLARKGARKMLMPRWPTTSTVIARNGKARPRKVTTGSGTVEMSAPRVNDKRVDERGNRRRFTSRLLPPYMRHSPKVAEVLPLLYLHGLSTGDFKQALPVLLGDDASGLSATAINRMTAEWEAEYKRFRKRDLSGRAYVYVFVDGLPMNVRLEVDRLCMLIMVGVTEDGSKEVIAIEDGYRESKESWSTVLRDLEAEA